MQLEHIFIFDLTPGFNGLDKGNCKTWVETFKLRDLVWLILNIWRYATKDKGGSPQRLSIYTLRMQIFLFDIFSSRHHYLSYRIEMVEASKLLPSNNAHDCCFLAVWNYEVVYAQYTQCQSFAVSQMVFYFIFPHAVWKHHSQILILLHYSKNL